VEMDFRDRKEKEAWTVFLGLPVPKESPDFPEERGIKETRD